VNHQSFETTKPIDIDLFNLKLNISLLNEGKFYKVNDKIFEFINNTSDNLFQVYNEFKTGGSSKRFEFVKDFIIMIQNKYGNLNE